MGGRWRLIQVERENAGPKFMEWYLVEQGEVKKLKCLGSS